MGVVLAGDALTPSYRSAVLPPYRHSATPAYRQDLPLRIAFVGDINFARSLARDYIFAGRGGEIFGAIAERLRGYDLTIGNLESIVLERGSYSDPTGVLRFAGPVQSLPLLLEAGFDGVGTANNHAWDFGWAGLMESLGHLNRQGIPNAGTGPTLADAWRPLVYRVNGWTIAVFSLTAIINWPGLGIEGSPAACCVAWADTALAARWFRLARDSIGAQRIYAFVHAGPVEYQAVPHPRVVALFRGLINAGADAVIGHHPHVPQGMELWRGRPIAYSLGNFVFRQYRPWTDRGLLAELIVRGGQPDSIRLVPLAVGYTARVLEGADSARVMAHVDSISRLIGLPNGRARRNVARPAGPAQTRRTPRE